MVKSRGLIVIGAALVLNLGAVVPAHADTTDPATSVTAPVAVVVSDVPSAAPDTRTWCC